MCLLVWKRRADTKYIDPKVMKKICSRENEHSEDFLFNRTPRFKCGFWKNLDATTIVCMEDSSQIAEIFN